MLAWNSRRINCEQRRPRARARLLTPPAGIHRQYRFGASTAFSPGSRREPDCRRYPALPGNPPPCRRLRVHVSIRSRPSTRATRPVRRPGRRRLNGLRRTPRPPGDQVADLITAQQQRRGAPAGSPGGPRSSAPAWHRRGGDRPAGRRVRRAPLHAAEGHHGTSARGPRDRQEHQMPAIAVFWIDAEDHDWDEVSTCTVLDADVQPRTVRLPAPAGAGSLPVGRLTLDARHRRRARRTGGGAAADRVHRLADDQAPLGLQAGPEHERRVREAARIHPRRVRPHRLRRRRPGREGPRARRVRARGPVPGPHGGARARGGRRSWCASAITPR